MNHIVFLRKGPLEDFCAELMPVVLQSWADQAHYWAAWNVILLHERGTHGDQLNELGEYQGVVVTGYQGNLHLTQWFSQHNI